MSITQEQAAQAIRNGDIGLVETAIRDGLEGFAANDVLKYSLCESNYDIAQMAVNNGANVDVDYGHLLPWAVGIQDEQAVAFLIKNGININEAMAGIMFRLISIDLNPKIKQMLLDAGANFEESEEFQQQIKPTK